MLQKPCNIWMWQDTIICGTNMRMIIRKIPHVSYMAVFAQEAAVNWNLVEKHPYIIGDFVWTALDYLGEAGIGHTLELSKRREESSVYGLALV